MFKKLFFLSCISLTAGVTARAQAPAAAKDTTDDADEPAMVLRDTAKKARELQSVEIRAIRASADAPFAKTDLKKADITRINLGQDLPMLLQMTPSVVVNSDAGNGVGYTGVRIRGTDPSRINVTFNGMPVNDPEEQGTYFVDIPDIASSTNSIQVQRGVGTSTNGAGAFGGTISISNLQQMDTAGVVYSTGLGSFNTYRNTLSAGTGLLKHGWQFDVRLSKISSDGYIQRSASDLKSMQFTAGWTPNNNTSFHFLFMPGTEKTGQAWNGVPQDSLSTNRKFNELGIKADGTYYNNQTDNYKQNYYQLFGDHKFSSSFTGHIGLFLTRGAGYYEEYKTDQSFADYGLQDIVSAKGDTTTSTDLIRRKWLDNYYYGSVFSLLYSKKQTHLTLGGGWSQFDNQHYGNIMWSKNGGVADNYEYYKRDANKNDANIYLKLEQTLGKWILFGDAQYRAVNYYINGFDNRPELKVAAHYNFFNPKAGITYLLSNNFDNKQRVYASVAVGNREPGRSDFEVDKAHQPKAERLTDIEAGYEINKRIWSAGANLYYMDYLNQLVLTGQINDVGAYTKTNVASSYRAGVEIMGSYTATRWLRLMANATFSQNKIKNYTEFIDNYDSTAQRVVNHGTTDIGFSPNLIGAVTVALTPFTGKYGKKFEMDITGKYVGKEYLDNTGNENRIIKQYNYCNVLLRYSLNIKPFKEVVASLALNNIFGAFYENNGYTFSYIYDKTFTTQNYYYPQAGFNVLGGITFRW